MNVFLSLSLSLCVCVSLFLFVSVSVSLFLFVSVCLCLSLSVCFCLSLCLSVSLSISLSQFVFVCLSLALSLSLSVSQQKHEKKETPSLLDIQYVIQTSHENCYPQTKQNKQGRFPLKLKGSKSLSFLISKLHYKIHQKKELNRFIFIINKFECFVVEKTFRIK